MEQKFDVLIAGAGYAGAVAARALADRGKRALVLERRPHVGGNAYDRLDGAGVLIHQYGPHIFHTNDNSEIARTGCPGSPGGGTMSTGWWPTSPMERAAA